MPFTTARNRTAAVLVLASAWTFYAGSARAEEGDFSDMLSQGNKAMEQGRLEDASEWYEEAIKLEPGSPDAHNQLGLCYSRRNMLLEAAGEFHKALTIDKNFLPSLNNLGSVMYRQSNYDAAVKFYKMALAVKDDDPEIQVNLASVYRDRATYVGGKNRDADFREAVNLYEHALKDAPSFAPAHNNLGLCYLRLRRFGDAEQAIQKAIEMKNDYAAAYFNLGLVYQAQHKLPEAVSAFQNSLRYETVGQYAEGTRRKIQELGMPETANTDHFSRGFDLLSQKKWSDAESAFKQAVEQHPRSAVAWNNLGYARSRQNKNKEAVEAYSKAINLLFQFPAAHYNYGQALVALRNLDGAEKEFRRALEQAHGRYPLAHNALAIVLKQKGDQKAALAQYKMALLQSGDTLPVVHYNLAVLYEEQGNKAGAREEYKLYLFQSPSGYNAAHAKERLSALGT
jgi:tetratricopeptide (TPR) repeat protein